MGKGGSNEDQFEVSLTFDVWATMAMTTYYCSTLLFSLFTLHSVLCVLVDLVVLTCICF